ncbi:phage tail tape measure protein [Robinsoniella peoriensis]|uniref:phage tail tape measure protein n=1 Tax=Robinsoniella peoriensis TaxID=180332 RepID=UPI0005C7DD8F|nr:phage tail tape measure protein [Robinsoniella peoriensis]
MADEFLIKVKAQLDTGEVEAKWAATKAKLEQPIKINVDASEFRKAVADSSFGSAGAKAGKQYSQAFSQTVANNAKASKIYFNTFSRGLNSKSGDVSGDVLRINQSFDKAIKSGIGKELSFAKSQANEFKASMKSLGATIDTSISPNRVATGLKSLDEWMAKNTKSTKQYGDTLKALRSQLASVNNVADFDKIQGQIKLVQGQAATKGLLGKDWLGDMKGSLEKYGVFLSSFAVINGAVRGIKQTFQDVYDIDTAMTSLYKVTNETSDTYDKFLDSATQKATKLGRSMTSVIEQTSKWAKLGYNLDESSKLAETSSIYANVGEVDDNTAVADLVTTMKSFGIASNESMQIADKLNKLGNEFATDSAALGTGIKNSASALSLAGNDLNESLAMITGMTEINQNASESGNALKVLSMRLRGMKGKLEEMEEDASDVLPVSKIQTQILNRTQGAVDIMDDLDPTKFKSTYEIMQGIADVWDRISETDQADLLEIVAGKQRGNSIAALIKSFQSGQTQKALNASINSEGSAQAEQDRWMTSLQAKISQFTAAKESLSSTLVDSDFLKGIVEFGTTGVTSLDHMIDKFGTLKTMIAGIATFSAFRGKGVSKYNKESDRIEAGGFLGNLLHNVNKQSKTPDDILDMNMSSGIIKSYKESNLSASDFLKTQNQVGASLAQYIATTDKAELSSSGFTQTLNRTTKVATGLGAGLKKLGAFSLNLGTNMLIGAGIELAIRKIQDYAQEQERAIQKGQDTLNEFQQQQSSLASAGQLIEASGDRFIELGKGVNAFGENISLSSEEFAEYNQIASALGDTLPNLANGFTDLGTPIITAKENVKQLTEALKEQQSVLNKENISNASDYMKAFNAKNDKEPLIKFADEAGLKQKIEMIEHIDDYLAGNFVSANRDGVSMTESIGIDNNTIKQIGKDLGYDFSSVWLGVDKDAIKENLDAVKEYGNQLKLQQESAVQEAHPIIESYLGETSNFKNLTEDAKTTISALVNSIDYEFASSHFFNKDNNLDSSMINAWADQVTTDLQKEGIQDKISELFLLNDDKSDMTFKEYSQKANSLMNDITKDVTGLSKSQLSSASGFTDAMQNFETHYNRVKDSIGNDVDKLSLDKLERAFTIISNTDYDLNYGQLLKRMEAAEKVPLDVNATPKFDEWEEASGSENDGDKYVKMAEGLKKAKELYDKGLVGTDDFKKYAALISPTGMDDPTNFMENYGKFERYFNTEESSGVQNFLEDLKSKGFADLTTEVDESGKSIEKWKYNIDDLQKAAQETGMGFEPFMAMFGRLQAYGFSNNMVASVEDGTRHVASLYGELAKEEAKLKELQKPGDYETTDENGNVTKSLGNQTAIDQTKSKIDELKGSIQETLGFMDQLVKQSSEERDQQVSAAKNTIEQLQAQKKQVLESDNENKDSVAAMIQDQIDALAQEYHISIQFETELNTSNNTLDNSIEAVKSEIEHVNDSLVLTPEVKAEKLQALQSELAQLVFQKDQLNSAVVMQVDTSQVDSSVGSIITKLQEFETAKVQLDSLNGMQEAGLTVDASQLQEAQGQVDNLVSEIQTLSDQNPEISASLNLKTDSVATIQASIQNMTKEVLIDAKVNPAAINAYKPEEKDSKVKFNPDFSQVVSASAPLKDGTVNYTASWDIGDPPVKNQIVNIIKREASAQGGAYAQGNAYANGTPMIKSARFNAGVLGTAYANGNANPVGQVLIGELGREIVVDPNAGEWETYGDNGAEFARLPKNAIVFNHLQSEKLLRRGFVAGRGTLKGGALANGNARAGIGGGGGFFQGGAATGSNKNNQSATNQNTAAVNSNTQAQEDNTKKTKESKAEIDNFATRLSWLERQAKNITDSITEYVSFAFKSAKIKAQSKLNDTRISANQRSYEGYLNKANSIELSEDWKQKVRDGDFSIDTIDTSTDDGKKLKENIDNYQKWYDKALDCKDAVAELRREQTKLFDELMNIPTEKAEKKIEKLNDKLDLLEANYDAASSGSSATIQKRIQLKEKLEPQKKTAKSKNKITRKAKKEFNAADERMEDSADAAIKAVNKSGLSRTKKNRLKKQINAGKKISTKGFSGKKLKAVEAYDQSVSKRSSAKKSYKSAKKVSDKANNKVARTEKELRNLNRNDAQETYKEQNAILDEEVTNQKSQYNTYKKADKEADKNVKSTKKTVKSKGNSLLKSKNKNIQKQEAAIKAGKTISTKGLKGDDLKKAKAYNEAVKKNNLALNAQTKAANNAAKAQAELASKMAEVANQQMENIKAFYEAKGTYLSSNSNKASKNRELKVAQGKAVTENDFEAEIVGKRNEKTNLVSQQKAMQDQFNSLVKSGKIKAGSEDWYKWQADIDGIGNAASDAEIEIQNLLDSQKNIKVTNMGYSLDRLKAQADSKQDDISLNEKKGILATAGDYNTLKTNSEAQVTNLAAQNKEYEAQQKGLDINSEKYQEIQSKMEANKSAIRAAQQNQEEWNHTIENLPIEKLKKELELLDAQKSNLESIINLKKAQSADLSKDDYDKQLNKNKEEIEKQKAIKSAAEENAKKYAGDPDNEYFKQYTQEALDADTAINNLEADNEELKDSMRNDIYFRDLERMLEVTEHLRNSLSTIASLITDEMMFDDDGKMTDFGITKLATSIKEYESYMDDIQTIQKKIATIEGLKGQEGYSEKEYLEDLKNAQEELNEAIKNGGSAREAILSIMKSQSKAELDAIFKVIDARNKLLQKTEDYYNYDKNMKKSSKELQQLKAQAAALDGVTDAESRAQKARLDAQIKEKEEEIEDTVHEQTIKIQMDGLDELKAELQEDYDKYIKDLAQNLDKITDLINGATDIVTSSFGKVGETIQKMLESFGVDPGNFDWSGLGGAAKGGIIEKKIRSNGDSLLASVNPGETILTQDFTKILPEALFTMKAFHAQFADSFTPKTPKIVPRVASINQQIECSLNVQGGNTTEEMIKVINQQTPKIAKYTLTAMAKDLRKAGW